MLEAIENFPPRHWDKILLGESPGREEQIENLKKEERNTDSEPPDRESEAEDDE